MKLRLFIIVLFVEYFNSFSCKGQQLAQYSQYMLNNYVLNPAVAGSSPCTDFKLGYRTQWVGFEARPRTMFASFYKPFKFKKKSTLGKGRHAFGAYVENDVTGPSSRTVLYLSYSYHLQLTRNYRLGMGLFGGFMQYSFNNSGLTTATAGDATISGAGNHFIVPDFSPGIWLYSHNHYLGLSAKSIVGNKIFNDSKLTRNFYLTTGYRILGKGAWSFIPSTFVRYTPKAPIGFDLNLMVDYSNIIEVGLSYRNNDAINALLKLNVGKLTIGYSFDYNLSQLRVGNSNTHEIILGLKLCPVDFNNKNSSHGFTAPNTNHCPAYN